MGIRVGGSLGPLSGSMRVSPTAREFESVARVTGPVVVGLVAVLLAVMLLPPIILCWGGYQLVRSWRYGVRARVGFGLVTAVSAVAFAVVVPLMYAPIYGDIRYGEPVPDYYKNPHPITAAKMRVRLSAAGFEHVSLAPYASEVGPLGDACRVWDQEPSSGKHDVRDNIKLFVDC